MARKNAVQPPPAIRVSLRPRLRRLVEKPPSRAVRTTAKKIPLLLFGWGFIFGGMLGIMFPILPGALFVIMGLLILSSEYVWANHLLQKIRVRFPALSSRLNQAAAKAHKWTGNAEWKENTP